MTTEKVVQQASRFKIVQLWIGVWCVCVCVNS